jgi:hypothetical protein
MTMSTTHSSRAHDTNAAAGAAHAHESSEVQLGPSLRFALGLAALCIVTFFLMRWLLVSVVAMDRASDALPHPLAAERQFPPEPQLQSMPGVPLVGGETLEAGATPFASTGYAELAKKQEKALASYGWIDRQAGVVHIPIERAIDLVLEQGLPTAETKSNKR